MATNKTVHAAQTCDAKKMSRVNNDQQKGQNKRGSREMREVGGGSENPLIQTLQHGTLLDLSFGELVRTSLGTLLDLCDNTAAQVTSQDSKENTCSFMFCLKCKINNKLEKELS